MSCIPIINGPVELYWAPVGTAFPTVEAAPAVDWVLVGQSGSNHQTEDGVVVNLSETSEVFRGQSLYPVCKFRTEVEGLVTVSIAETSLETLRLALNLNPISADPGPPSIESIDLNVGSDVAEVALLIRGEGKSPIFEDGNMQYEILRAALQNNSEITYTKSEAASISLEFMMMLDTSGGFPGEVGRIVYQAA